MKTTLDVNEPADALIDAELARCRALDRGPLEMQAACATMLHWAFSGTTEQKEAADRFFQIAESMLTEKAGIAAMTPAQRVEAFDKMTAGYCRACGSDVLPCHCEDDE